jgi:hypothetical protein
MSKGGEQGLPAIGGFLPFPAAAHFLSGDGAQAFSSVARLMHGHAFK